MIGMLKRPEGATIPKTKAATGWLSHTVRGTFAGAFKKNLGLALVTDKREDDQVYRIAGCRRDGTDWKSQFRASRV